MVFVRQHATRGLASWIEEYQASIGRDPKFAAARLEKVVDRRVRQPLIDAVIRERVAVKARQPFVGAEPKKAVRVAHNLIDDVVRQTVGDRVSFEWQTFSSGGRAGEQQGEKVKARMKTPHLFRRATHKIFDHSVVAEDPLALLSAMVVDKRQIRAAIQPGNAGQGGKRSWIIVRIKSW